MAFSLESYIGTVPIYYCSGHYDHKTYRPLKISRCVACGLLEVLLRNSQVREETFTSETISDVILQAQNTPVV